VSIADDRRIWTQLEKLFAQNGSYNQ